MTSARSNESIIVVTNDREETIAQLSPNKRRRSSSSQKNKEELAYIAATIQNAALQTRRERALPMGCGVDMSTVKLVTAAEYDDEWSSEYDEGQRQQKRQKLHQEMDCSKSEKGERTNDDAVMQLQIYENLFLSTRQHYTNDSAQLATVTPIRSPTAATNTRSSSPNSSGGNSTWSPSSLSTELCLKDTTTATHDDLNNDYTKRKYIDNDNRSDGQSSDMGNGWYSSDTDSVSSSDDEREEKDENEEEIRKQNDLGQQVQQQQRGDRMNTNTKPHQLDAPYSAVG